MMQTEFADTGATWRTGMAKAALSEDISHD